MNGDRFKLETFSPGAAEVYLWCEEGAITWPVVEQLDRAGIQVVGRLPEMDPTDQRIRLLMSGCAGVVATSPSLECERLRAEFGIPLLDVRPHSSVNLEGFQAAVLKHRDRIRPYALLIGRLERDFSHAREAIRVGVEAAAGIACLWIDDGRHRTNVHSVREHTRLLIKHATFVIAELTLGAESPERENPSRAHEIGMAIAYERPLMLCSQEPRRYPYFSIADMQMTFWSTEDELGRSVEGWVYANRELVARRVFNYELPAPVIAKPAFRFDPEQHYEGPKTSAPHDVRRLLAKVGVK